MQIVFEFFMVISIYLGVFILWIFVVDYKIFGCKVNKYYLNKWLNYFSNHENIPNSCIIATCVVTDRAKDKFIKETMIQLAKWKHIYLTWCAVFDEWKKMEEDKFYSIYPQLVEYRDQITLLSEEPDRDDTRETKTHKFKENANIYTKNFIVIQNGCDSHCSFCLTVSKRWSSQSIQADEIIEQIDDFVDVWGKEIVITWVNLAARGCSNTKKPEESQFSDLLQYILDETEIERIRISSLWPEFLDEKFFEVVKNPRFLPHFHFSIQSFSDSVLKAMNRNYDSQRLDYVLTKIRNLDRSDRDQISIWADIIVWFAWETDEDFQQTVEWVKKYKITKLHAFPFSSHDKWESIPAHLFRNQVPFHIKKQRERKLISIWNEIREKFIAENKWLPQKVLVEEKKNGKWRGWTGNYIQVELDWERKRGEIVEVVL